jgi:arylsulfatase A-like enzyme
MPEARRAAPAVRAALLFPLLFSACGGETGPASSAPRSAGSPPNVVLLTVDTLRPDHLGCLAYSRDTSPYIDRLAARGVVFRDTITAAGRTVQSFPSILTGVYPPEHGLRYEGQMHDVLEGRLTLTRALRDHGYDAFAVTQGLNVGLHRDFDIYDPDIYIDPDGKKVYLPTRNDREASRKAAQWLRGRRGTGRPFFLWMRYNAPHWPYEAPDPYTEMFDEDYRGGHSFNEAARPGVEKGAIIFGLERLPEREVEHAIAHYDAEVRYADRAIGDLVEAIDTMGLGENTIYVLTSDHGESFGEHDYFFEHGAYLYEPTVRVPLIVSAPGRLPPGRVIGSQARTIDIMPTILDLVGIPLPAGLQGVSLVPRTADGGDRPGPPAYSESGRNFYPENPRQYINGIAGKWRMLRTSRHKVILIPREPEPIWEVYDLQADPGETDNLIDRMPEEAAQLQSLLTEIVANDPGRNDREEPPLPDELQEHLRSLGYVGGSDSK